MHHDEGTRCSEPPRIPTQHSRSLQLAYAAAHAAWPLIPLAPAPSSCPALQSDSEAEGMWAPDSVSLFSVASYLADPAHGLKGEAGFVFDFADGDGTPAGTCGADPQTCARRKLKGVPRA